MTAAACSAGQSGTGSATGKAVELVVDTPAAKGEVDSVRWNLGTEPNSVDWIYSYDYPPNTVIANVCESLLRLGPDFSIRPNLAEKVDHPDARTWVYTIRQGVRFHDGTTMTPEDVAYSLRRHMDSKLGSYWAEVYRNVTSVKVTGAHRVTVRLTRPDSLFNQLMATPPGVVASKAYVEKQGSKFGTPDGGLDCTGPFKLAKWTKGQSITLTRFDGYWDTAHAAKTKNLEFAFLADPSTEANALVSGEVDGSYNIVATSLPKLLASGKGTVYYGPTTSSISLVVSGLKGALADQRIRKALSLAIDRKALLKTAYAGHGEPAKAVVSDFTWGQEPAKSVYQKAYDALPSVEQDLAQAKKLVQEAGAPSRPIVIAASSSDPINALMCTEVQAAGKRVGLDVRIKTVAPDAYSSLFSDPKARADIDLFPTSWYGDIADPLDVYVNWRSDSFANYGGYKSAEYDKLIKRAIGEDDAAKRAATVVQAQKTVSEQLLWIPLLQTPNMLFLSKRVTGAPATNAYLYYPWAAQIGSAQ
ncbi:ABC transporter substrate-binding protein [Streptomyces sp. NPDC057565]|uniref:ABC transporter substrate-binding protein n=1 Tax=Streptomyces sp. NPDC057565 TaxID=3346169 RepID=UPI00368F67EA